MLTVKILMVFIYFFNLVKPDNIMVSEDTKKIKLCDFGSCINVEETGITEYIASRYYRAPEIMIGL
jgi:serine/threonine-protein kinase PRP4